MLSVKNKNQRRLDWIQIVGCKHTQSIGHGNFSTVIIVEVVAVTNSLNRVGNLTPEAKINEKSLSCAACLPANHVWSFFKPVNPFLTWTHIHTLLLLLLLDLICMIHTKVLTRYVFFFFSVTEYFLDGCILDGYVLFWRHVIKFANNFLLLKMGQSFSSESKWKLMMFGLLCCWCNADVTTWSSSMVVSGSRQRRLDLVSYYNY